MKKQAAILYLFVILLQATSTLWILGSFYMNRDYISQNLCINRFDAIPICKGQCYLDKELREDKRQEQEFPNIRQKEIQLFFEEKQPVYNAICESVNTPDFPRHSVSFYSNNFHPSIFHPPQAA